MFDVSFEVASFPGFYRLLQVIKHTASYKSLGDKPGNEASFDGKDSFSSCKQGVGKS